MSWSKPRTTFNAEELERHSGAQNRIFGLYEKLGKYQPSLSSKLSDAAMQAHKRVSDPQLQCDSGLGDELPDEELSENGPPKPPMLITDSENLDSGYGPECMDTDDDDVEKDSIIKARPDPPSKLVTTANTKANIQFKGVRRPKVNHLPKTTVPIAATNSKVTSATVSPKTVHTYSQKTSAVAAQRPNVTAVKQKRNLQRVKNTSRSWETTLDIIEFQRNIQYLLPNKDGDT